MAFLYLLPRLTLRINLKDMLREDLCAIARTCASLDFFNLFKIFGDFLKLQEKWVLIALYFYFLAIDLHLKIQDDLI
ncbi:unnamed protein product [Arabidopsis halleri]